MPKTLLNISIMKCWVIKLDLLPTQCNPIIVSHFLAKVISRKKRVVL